MNEDEMNRLFAGYRDSLGTCGKTTRTHRQSAGRVRWAFAVGAVVILTGGLSLWPTDAGAKAVGRIQDAILNAQTMEMTNEEQRPSGRWLLFDHEYTRNGMWRYETRQGSNLEATYIVRDGQTVEDYRRLDHATLAPGKLSDRDGAQSALDYAKEMMDGGRAGIERKIEVRVHAPVAGVPTYMLTLDRAEDAYHGEILVDARNDLPISSEFSVRYKDGAPPNRYRQTYRFNVPLPDALFKPSPHKPLIQTVQAQAQLEDRWKKPLAQVGETAVRDACVTEDGTVWITVTVPIDDKRRTIPLPAGIAASVPYARLRDLGAATMIMGYQPIHLFGDDVVIVGFVPLDPKSRPGSRVTVLLDRRATGYANEWSSSAPPEEPGEEVTIPLRRATGDRPEFFSALLLDHFGFQLPLNVEGTRATALVKSGRDLEAAKAYERQAAAYAGFIRRLGATPLREAAKRYETLGLSADAARVRAQATSLDTVSKR